MTEFFESNTAHLRKMAEDPEVDALDRAFLRESANQIDFQATEIKNLKSAVVRLEQITNEWYTGTQRVLKAVKN